MKKIGILTLQNAINYGAVLQCYALQKKIEELDCECEVINYINPHFEKIYSPFYVERFTFRKILFMMYAFKYKRKRVKVFQQFCNKQLTLSPGFSQSTIQRCVERYSAIIVGSDQVWNLSITKNDENYFLGFADAIKRFSYAASFGDLCIDEEYRERYTLLLNNIDEISVREEDGAEIVRELCGRDANVNIDPVLLFDKNNWVKIADEIDDTDYILVYKINRTACYEVAKELSRRTRLKVKVIAPDRNCPSNFVKYKAASPGKFVGLFVNAKVIVTDSYHGLLFSIVNEKQFFVCFESREDNANIRLNNVLRKFDLESQIIQDIHHIERGTKIDYVHVNKLIEEERKKSEMYLSQIIDKI